MARIGKRRSRHGRLSRDGRERRTIRRTLHQGPGRDEDDGQHDDADVEHGQRSFRDAYGVFSVIGWSGGPIRREREGRERERFSRCGEDGEDSRNVGHETSGDELGPRTRPFHSVLEPPLTWFSKRTSLAWLDERARQANMRYPAACSCARDHLDVRSKCVLNIIKRLGARVRSSPI